MKVTSKAIVDLILLGPSHDRRQLQDSPILGDVWAGFASKPQDCIDLLISPYKTEPAGRVAREIAKRMREVGRKHPSGQEAHVAYLQGVVAARLYFAELLEVVVPLTKWWQDQEGARNTSLKSGWTERIHEVVSQIHEWVMASEGDDAQEVQMELAREFGHFSAIDRYAGLAAIILYAGEAKKLPKGTGIVSILNKSFNAQAAAEYLGAELDRVTSASEAKPSVWQVSLNRTATPALQRSVSAVKGDAAKDLFKVKCDEIAWAVLDSGIDASHPAFKIGQDGSRVIKSYDFSNIREVVSLDNRDLKLARKADHDRVKRLLRVEKPTKEEMKEAAAKLKRLGMDAEDDRPVNWGLVADFVDITRHKTPPPTGHGTHVAGIIGADGHTDPNNTEGDGMCPDIKLYDFRVLGRSSQDTEFAVIAALQYVRYLNERNNFITIHGANLSLSIPHDVRNFACGRTPICDECERLVESGVVVVAAAGNLGYHTFETKEGYYEGYMALSITDPGNADGVITVGSTHRFWPHTYGVSFFSSRGPTGDGRLKPDLVAPGERIRSTVPGKEWGDMDGTSMAAPHVSGAAAMLMARYSELIGKPRRVKELLCASATDLGRERSFQGHGMLDVLRAFQKM